MIKLTRLNHQTVAINPDHIAWVEASPDTTLCLLNGDRLLVRETVDELIDLVVAFRQKVRAVPQNAPWHDSDAVRIDTSSMRPPGRGIGTRNSSLPPSRRGDR
jgi:flagellar protein FlbD